MMSPSRWRERIDTYSYEEILAHLAIEASINNRIGEYEVLVSFLEGAGEACESAEGTGSRGWKECILSHLVKSGRA